MDAVPAISRLYWRLETLIDPGVRSSQYIYREVVDANVDAQTRWLDVGCGHSIFPEWIDGQRALAARAASTVGIDYTVGALGQHSTIRRLVAGDVLRLPFAPERFSLVTANMVVEHLADPIAALAEISRILRPGGRFIFHTPNLWFYQIRLASLVPQGLKTQLVAFSEQRAESDIFRTFYRMNSARAIQRVTDASHLTLVELRKMNTSSIGEIFLFGPFVIGALLVRRVLRLEALQNFRSNFIGVLEKPESPINDAIV